MLERLRQATWLALLAWLLAGYCYLRWVASSQRLSSQNYRDKKANYSQPKNDKQETWVQRAAGEPLAVFTLFLAVIAAAQVGLFYVQLKLIRSSLDTTKESAETAKTQAEISQATLKTMQDTAERQLRAYIGHREIPFETRIENRNGVLISTPGPVKYFDCNYGSTPAKDVTMHVLVVSGGAPAVLDEELNESDRQAVVQIVHPGQNVGRIVGAFTRNDTFFLYGYVSYTDIIGERWRHRFAFSHNTQRRDSGSEAWVAHDSYNDEQHWDKTSQKWV
jgi:hypothetical protein